MESIKMGTKAKSKRYLDNVELFKTDKAPSDYGTMTNVETSIGTFGANVEVMTGSRLERYKQFGYSYPVIIKMYAVNTPFSILKWRGKTLQVKSLNEDKNNVTKIIIYADMTNETLG